MNLRHCLYPLIFAAIISGCAATASPYGAPPDTSDPWQLIKHARGWLQQGRPRGALPSLQKALVEVERLDHETADYAHAKAAIHNELGRVHEMASELEVAEAQFLQAAEIARRVPQRRPLHFDISYNLSTVYERKAQPAASCAQLRRTVALHQEMLARPSEPPDGYGADSERFLREVATPRIRARALRIGCDIGLAD
jgi:tetratricopeptide (TPR) repeat protein